MIKQIGYCTFLLVIGLFHSCNFSDNESVPDVSAINIETVTINRFEHDLFLLDTLNISTSFENLKAKYPEFLPLYIFEIQGFATSTDSDDIIANKLKNYIYNTDIRNVLMM